jgi:hypothetical protein
VGMRHANLRCAVCDSWTSRLGSAATSRRLSIVVCATLESGLTLPKATKADVEAYFATHGTGEITEIKLMNGFGFIEYKDAMDARDVVPGQFCQRYPESPPLCQDSRFSFILTSYSRPAFRMF